MEGGENRKGVESRGVEIRREERRGLEWDMKGRTGREKKSAIFGMLRFALCTSQGVLETHKLSTGLQLILSYLL